MNHENSVRNLSNNSSNRVVVPQQLVLPHCGVGAVRDYILCSESTLSGGMEEGSLLQLALDRTSATASASGADLRNCLFLDVYSLRDEWTAHSQDGTAATSTTCHLLYLAELADRINGFLQAVDYLWHYGCDGPVFGIHATEGIPHLRAYCRYGPSVQDEWMAIHYLREFMMRNSKREETGEGNYWDDIAATAWDVEDGQIILIQMADVLPPWLDEDSTDNHRHACWLYRGSLQLFQKSHISLLEAIEQLKRLKKEKQVAGDGDGRAKDLPSSTHPRIQRALEYWLELNVQESQLRQRTPLVLPRTVAKFLRDRPELVHTAIQAFCDHLGGGESPSVPSRSQHTALPDLGKYTDWVWTRHTMSRTNYAMVRTMVSSQGWTTPDALPPTVGVEVKRYRRQCSMESTPHLKHAVALGVRVVAGLEYLLAATSTTSSLSPISRHLGFSASAASLPSLDERISLWSRIERECSQRHRKNQGKSLSSSATSIILNSFRLGPNHSDLDLTYVLKCPVFPEEDENLTVLSHPQTSIREQVLHGLKQASKDDSRDSDEDGKYWMPRPDQIDGDEWMEMSPDGSRGTAHGEAGSVQDLNRMLSRFQAFMKQTSDLEGIASGNRSLDDAEQGETSMEIRPHIFLNILHTVLKGGELSFPRSETVDPFFYKDDYDLMQEDLEDQEKDDVDGRKEGALGMKDLMVRFFERTMVSPLQDAPRLDVSFTFSTRTAYTESHGQ
jgi:hypothetical protein